jgi:hypothetical protein
MSQKKAKKSKSVSQLRPDEQELTGDKFVQMLQARRMERYGRPATEEENDATIEADMVAILKEVTDPPAEVQKKVKLLQVKGRLPFSIEAEVNDSRELHISSSEVISKLGGGIDDTRCISYLTLSESNKDLLLLALLERSYSGNKELISELREFLKAKGLRCSFSTYLDMDL